MKTFVRRVAVVIGAVAVSAGLIGASAVPAHADDSPTVSTFFKDTSWGR
ncbi:hypothetical protein G5V58_21695 [Nocardioides anomalus]|uniref:Uncharacterized protein n=1 Tax=Nocardioides anomalus TaxID=2712223 RepID=A0A6G6WIG5_9ACTN|nr:hypothetical protein [Nocardioides anomalus]QIG45034.1 hypothetical protein G5V58_21695 [Nocardioides anomalus]